METALQKTVPGNLETFSNNIPGQRAITQMINSDQNLRKIARIIAVKVNSLYAYPLTKSQIEDWVEIIYELMPGLTSDVLNGKINKAITGEFEWDLKKGIQNLFAVVEGPWHSISNKRRIAAEQEFRERQKKEQEEWYKRYEKEQEERYKRYAQL